MRIVHPFEPVCGENARILILGTMASPASREAGFYYGHPRNRFWPLMSAILGFEAVPERPEDKARMLTGRGIALWDVLAECDIKGADDSAIRNPKLNDIAGFMDEKGIGTVFVNGRVAGKLLQSKAGIPAVVLPSTSPANAKMGFGELLNEWSVILSFLSPEGV